MHKLFALLTIALVAGCSTVDSVYNATQGIVGGVKADVVGITTGTLETVSGVIKDTAEKTEPKAK
jgi:uncharacterized protein YceK